VNNQDVSFFIENGQREYASQTTEKDAQISNVKRRKNIHLGTNYSKKYICNMINVN
jgi:hypothetical protein